MNDAAANRGEPPPRKCFPVKMFGLTCVVGAFISASGGVSAESVFPIELSVEKDSATYETIDAAIQKAIDEEDEEYDFYGIRILDKRKEGIAYSVDSGKQTDSIFNSYDLSDFSIEAEGTRSVGLLFTRDKPKERSCETSRRQGLNGSLLQGKAQTERRLTLWAILISGGAFWVFPALMRH